MRSHISIIRIGALSAALALLSGCRDPKVSVYDVPKESNNMAQMSDRIPAPNPTVQNVSWSPAEQWQVLDSTQFRKGNYQYSDENGLAEITVSSFPGDTGGLLANVNRWLRQAQLPEINHAHLVKIAEERPLAGGFRYTVVDLKDENADPSATRIYAAVLPYQGQSWFFKMSGPSSTVESQIPAFDAMMSGLRVGSGSAPAAQASQAAAPKSSDDEIAFGTPEGWIPSEQGSSIRIASMSVEKEGLPPADFSLIAFPGDTGGIVANVNRWRRQIGLEDWTPEEVDAAGSTFSNRFGHAFLFFDLKPESEGQERILAAVLEHGGKSWFFKLRGDAFLIDTQINKFRSLLETVHFDHTGHSH